MSGSATPFQHHQRLITDPDLFVDAVSGASLCVDLHKAMAGPARIEQFQSWDWAIDFSVVQVDARVRGEAPHGWATMALIRSDAGSRWAGQNVKPGTVLGNPPGVEIDGWVTPGFGWTSVSASPALWAEGGRLAGIEHQNPRHLIIASIPPSLYSRLESRLHHVHRLLLAAIHHPSLAPGANREARETALTLTSLVWELDAGSSRRNKPCSGRLHLARRAEEWMRHHLPEVVGIPDLCLALNVSRRELEYAFRATFDVSPWDYFQKLRLNAIYRDLRLTPANLPGYVTEIALTHGITHLGRFSAQYRNLFGERPSETLRRNHSRLK